MSAADTPPPGRKVLLVSAHVGAGHTQAARAIRESLLAAAPDLTVEHLEILTLTSRLFRAYYNGGYVLGMTRFPTIYGVCFRLTDRPHRPGRSPGERVRLWVERRCLRAFEQYLHDTRPQLIVHTHFLAPPMVARLIAGGKVDVPQMIVGTDIHLHRWWYSENIDHWFVPTEDSAAAPIKWGVAPERITVSGIPVLGKWTAPLDRDRIFADWRLDPARKIVVLSGGTEFVCGRVAEIASGIIAAAPDACVAVLAGRNKRLLADLSALPEAASGRLVPVPFTDRAHELLEVCSIMVTKPGGITTAECLAKATPMVLLDPVIGQESANADYLARAGVATIARNPERTVAETARLLADPSSLAAMADAARRLHRPATQIITERILETI